MFFTRVTRKHFLSFFAVAGSANAAPSASVFVGFPLRKSTNMIGNNQTTQLEKVESEEYVCLINRKDGRYYWSSRENREVSRNVSGNFTVYSALDGSGYVKICTQCGEMPVDYMEHLHDKLFTITYWGKSSIFRD